MTLSKVVENKTMSSLIKAVKENNLPKVEKLLSSSHVDPNEKDELTLTALYYAVLNRSYDMASLLLEYDADPDIKDRYEFTPFFAAIENKDSRMVELLLDFKANVDSWDYFLRSPLHVAAGKGSAKIVNILIQYGANIESRDAYDRTPLFEAIIYQHPLAVKTLIKLGARTDHHTKDNFSPLQYACYMGMMDIVKKISDRKVDLVNSDGYNALSYLIVSPYLEQQPDKREELLKFLLDKLRADPNVVYPDGSTPLHLAVKESQVDTVLILLSFGAEVDIEDTEGRTPLFYTVSEYKGSRGKVKIAEILLDAGAEINHVDHKDYTPLFWSIKNANTRLTKFLVDQGADTDTDHKGYPSLHYAARKGLFAYLDLFPTDKINEKDEKGGLPLYYVIREINRYPSYVDFYRRKRMTYHVNIEEAYPAIDYLLEQGADPYLDIYYKDVIGFADKKTKKYILKKMRSLK